VIQVNIELAALNLLEDVAQAARQRFNQVFQL